MTSPTQRSLKYLRDAGWLAWVVEKWIPQARKRSDLWGIADILAIRGADILAVQTTSDSNVSARVKKIRDHENTPFVRKAGIAIHVHGWKKAGTRWSVRVVDVS